MKIKKQLNFGDFVKKELSNPESALSARTRFYKNFLNLVKNHPDKYRFYWFAGYPTYEYKVNGRWENSDYPAYHADTIMLFR